MNLLALTPGSEATIENFAGDSQQLERFSEMGLYQGMPVKVIHKMPFKGPVVVLAGRFFIALREEEAQCIKIHIRP
ncbi:MAG: ferrous iron transport protein A [Pseudobdellovibrionaceae bacterium]|nr:ferrous iron transport protein A [Bdellovibrionales bacterium]USN47925.1 MAG: ferrous iron transport protein A [Pseudobdellovibrionaceae bacterium]